MTLFVLFSIKRKGDINKADAGGYISFHLNSTPSDFIYCYLIPNCHEINKNIEFMYVKGGEYDSSNESSQAILPQIILRIKEKKLILLFFHFIVK